MEKRKESTCILCAGNGCGEWKEQIRKIKGLKAQSRYRIDGKEYSGSVLMQAGIKVAQEFGDFKSRIFLVEENDD